MDKESILNVLFYARNNEIGKLKKGDQEFLNLIESSFDAELEFSDLDENVKKQIKEYVNKLQDRIGLVLSEYDIKYYKSRMVGLCKNIYGSFVLRLSEIMCELLGWKILG